MNRCTFIGNLGADPEVKSAGGSQVANFSVGCSERWTDKDGQKKERTEWVRCVAWGKLAGHIEKYLSKGSKVYVAGRMETRSYDKNGEKRYATEIIVSDIEFLGGKRGNDEDAAERRAMATPDAAYSQQSAPTNNNEDDIPF